MRPTSHAAPTRMSQIIAVCTARPGSVAYGTVTTTAVHRYHNAKMLLSRDWPRLPVDTTGISSARIAAGTDVSCVSIAVRATPVPTPPARGQRPDAPAARQIMKSARNCTHDRDSRPP